MKVTYMNGKGRKEGAGEGGGGANSGGRRREGTWQVNGDMREGGVSGEECRKERTPPHESARGGLVMVVTHVAQHLPCISSSLRLIPWCLVPCASGPPCISCPVHLVPFILSP
jgi:hypothetical protein